MSTHWVRPASTRSIVRADRFQEHRPEMASRVVKVRRPPSNLLYRKRWLSIFIGLTVSTAHMIRNLLGFARGQQDFTVYYPEQRFVQAPALRGMPVLVQMANGKERCVACGLCEWACPTACITIFPGETADEVDGYPRVFVIGI